MSSFSADITRFIRKTNLRAEKVVGKIALDLLSGVILRSPVDTGRFRANWRLAIGNIDLSAVQEPDLPTTNQSAILTAATAVLANYKLGDTIFISNNTEYALELEAGRSTQAPTGVLGVTFEEGKANLQAALNSIP